MTCLKTASAALVAGTIAFGALASVSAPAFASDQGIEVKPVKQMKVPQHKKSGKLIDVSKKPHKKNDGFKFAKFDKTFDKQSKKEAKYLAIGAAVGAIGYALISEYRNNRD